MRYTHESVDVGSLWRQHFVTDTKTGKPFLRTERYVRDSETDRQVADWLTRACDLMNRQAD